MFRPRMQVGEIAAASARDQNLLANSICAFQHQHAPATLAGFNGTHQARSTGSENDSVVWAVHSEMSLAGEASAIAAKLVPLNPLCLTSR